MAVPAISRRAMLRAIPTMAGAVALHALATEAVAHVDDPLLDTIAEYRAGCAAFCAAPDFSSSGEEEVCFEATLGPSLRRLQNWSEPAGSLRAVTEAIRLLLDESMGDNFMSEPLLAASLAYLDTTREVA